MRWWRATIVIPFLAAAGAVGMLLLSTTPPVENIPLESVAIDPRSLREVFFELGEGGGKNVGTGRWTLQYSVDTKQRGGCTSLFIAKQLFRHGDARAFASNGVVSTPIDLAGRADHTMILPEKLPVGSYTLAVTFTCQVDGASATPTVAAPVCFDVTKSETGVGEVRLEAVPCT